MDCGRAERRLLQGKALGKVAPLVRDAAPFSLVGPPDAAQPGKPETPISARGKKARLHDIPPGCTEAKALSAAEMAVRMLEQDALTMEQGISARPPCIQL